MSHANEMQPFKNDGKSVQSIFTTLIRRKSLEERRFDVSAG